MIWASICLDASLGTTTAQRGAARCLLADHLRRVHGFGARVPELVHDRVGRPWLAGQPGLRVSISHCRGAVLVATAPVPVGADVEDVRAPDPFAARMLGPDEQREVATDPDPTRAFFRYWVLKESYTKALGVGLAYPVRQLRVTISPDGSAGVGRPGAALRLHEGYADHVAALCWLGVAGEDAPAPRRVLLGELRERAG